MAGNCCGGSCGGGGGDPRLKRQADYRHVLRMAFVMNALMAVAAFGTALDAESLSLRALALVFLANAANHGASLWLVGWALDWRDWVNLARSLLLIGLGLWVNVVACWSIYRGTAFPDAWTMAMAGLMTLSVTLAVGMQLFAGRRGKPTLRTTWLCVRKDALACLAVVAAAVGTGTMGQGWPDGLAGVVLTAMLLATAEPNLRQAVAGLRARHGSPSATASGEEA